MVLSAERQRPSECESEGAEAKFLERSASGSAQWPVPVRSGEYGSVYALQIWMSVQSVSDL